MLFHGILQLIFVSYVSSRESCLGIQGACDLRLDEITIAGAHNAGAGFNGHLYYHNPYLIALSCTYRNQIQNVTAMLEAGIRYFDIDLCFESRDGYEKGVWTCHKDAYGGPMSKFLKQVNDWLNKPQNRREIVVLHFNRDHEKGEKEEIIGKTIVQQLTELWNPSEINIKTGKLVMQPQIDDLIGNAIKSNKRVYVFLHDRSKKDMKESFLFHQNLIGYTWVSMAYVGSNGCKNLAKKISDNCPYEARRKFVRLDLYLSWGLCIDDLASSCNKHLDYVTRRCYDKINQHRTYAQTVNFIVTDYSTEKPGIDAVKIAKEITERYIREN